MQKAGPLPNSGSPDSSQKARDEAVPGFVVSSLIAGLPFLGLMMAVSIVTGQEQVGRLVSLLATLLVEGLCISFFWRRVDPTAGKNFSAAMFAVGLWAFMAGCLVTTFGLRFGGMGDLARNVALLGSGVVAVSGFFFAIVWAQSQAPRLMVQTHSMIATSVVLAGFTALLLKGTPSAESESGETLHASTASVGARVDDSKGSESHASTASSSHGHGGEHEVQHTKPSEPHSETPHRELQADPHGGAKDGGEHDHAALAGHDDDDETQAVTVHEWSYEGTTGPETWGKIKPTWKACSNGREQSPIDIAKGSKESRRVISLSYEESSVKLTSNGELLQALVGRGSHALINGKAFELKRLDFHSPSEHELSGVSYPMEIQFVHTDTKGRTAIISAFVEKGPVHTEFGKILEGLPMKAGADRILKSPLNLGRILPRDVTALAHQYKGSLTTPPCTEGVLWTVLKTPLRMSGDQLASFRAQFAGSNRPIQPLGKRHIAPLEASMGH
jgi:carbonic anhydrase